MSGRDIFSKHLPNIKLATRFDADGREIEVEIREDEEQNRNQLEIFDILVAAGYFRAKIKGISEFDKIVGGMTWCIEACDFDVDIDLLFHENLTIGQKISLTEKIVAVLLKMKCPYLIEPHQIQGLDYINIFPVIQWLVKRSVENRAEKAEKLKRFATGEFHNYFQLDSDRCVKEENLKILQNLNKVYAVYGPRRQYRRREAVDDDEMTRIRVTLLEYGNQAAVLNKSNSVNSTPSKSPEDKLTEDKPEELENEEIDIEKLLKTLALTKEEHLDDQLELSETEKTAISQMFADLKSEMQIDSKELAEQNQIKALLATKAVLEKKLERLELENLEIEKILKDEESQIEKIKNEQILLKTEINELTTNSSDNDGILVKIQNLVQHSDTLKQEELQFRDNCKKEMARLQEEIEQATHSKSVEENLNESKERLRTEEETLQAIRLKLAKLNRAILSIQRQIDDVPDRTELSQYQKRFIELYNQVSATHKETKQFYTLYNTLDDTKLYLKKELSLLNSIYDNYNEAMQSQQTMEEYLEQFDKIVEGINQTKLKVKLKCDNEVVKRDNLNEILLGLVEQERKYATAVKQLTKECQRNDNLQKELKLLLRENSI